MAIASARADDTWRVRVTLFSHISGDIVELTWWKIHHGSACVDDIWVFSCISRLAP